MEILGLTVTILLALLGYFATYVNNLRLARRSDKLKHVTTQIDELYGPLYIITQTGQMLSQALRAKGLRRGKENLIEDSPASANEISEWRIWIEQVFQPLNEQLEKIIINKAHLIIEEEMPHCLKRFLAHSAGYKAVVAKWHLNDFSENTSVIAYPGELEEYAASSYAKLKYQQRKLIEGR
jgi:hypothetical protein